MLRIAALILAFVFALPATARTPFVQEVLSICSVTPDGILRNISVRLNPIGLYGNMQFVFRNEATGQEHTSNETMVGGVPTGASFMLPPGTYTLTIKANSTPGFAGARHILAKPIAAHTVNGQKVCREESPISPKAPNITPR